MKKKSDNVSFQDFVTSVGPEGDVPMGENYGKQEQINI